MGLGCVPGTSRHSAQRSPTDPVREALGFAGRSGGTPREDCRRCGLGGECRARGTADGDRAVNAACGARGRRRARARGAGLRRPLESHTTSGVPAKCRARVNGGSGSRVPAGDEPPLRPTLADGPRARGGALCRPLGSHTTSGVPANCWARVNGGSRPRVPARLGRTAPSTARRRTPCERRWATPAARAAHPERTAAGVDLAVSAGHEARPTVTGR